MNRISIKLGIWSSTLLIVAFTAWIVCFVGIALSAPLFFWTDLTDFLAYRDLNGQAFQNIAMFFMLLFGPLFVIYISSLVDYAPENKKPLIRISMLFAVGFAVLSSFHYFVQLSAVRLNIEQGNTFGLEHFVQANPNSVMTAINMCGWSLFLGLSSFFAFPVFNGDRPNKIIRWAFIINGISCILGGVGYAFQIDILTFIFINLGVGGAVLVIAITSLGLFKRLLRNP